MSGSEKTGESLAGDLALVKDPTLAGDLKKFTHDPIADTYDDKVRRAVARQDRLNYIREHYFEIQAQVMVWADLKPGLDVLDIGIGTAMMWEGLEVPVNLSGVDISPRMLKKAAAKGVKANLKEGHFLELPFEDRRFDRIVSTFAFHHVRHELKGQAFEELARVLRPGGRVVIGDLMFRNPAQALEVAERMQAEGRQDILGSIKDEYYTDIEALEAIIAPLGFRLECQRMSTLSWVVRVWGR